MAEVWNREGDVVEGDAFPIPAMLRPSLPPGGIDQNAPHRLGGGGEEVSPTFPPLGLLDIHQPQVHLVDESGGLQGLPRRFVGQASGREFLQFVVHQRQESLRRHRLALLNLSKNLGSFGHII